MKADFPIERYLHLLEIDGNLYPVFTDNGRVAALIIRVCLTGSSKFENIPVADERVKLFSVVDLLRPDDVDSLLARLTDNEPMYRTVREAANRYAFE